MCGIAGYYGNFGHHLLSGMVDTLSHRGPDGEGTVVFDFKNQQVGLGHRRLSILDLTEAGKQPMCFPADPSRSKIRSHSNVWITYNGEIYNFQELRADLESKGYRFYSRTDTEVILAMYVEYGVEAFSKLNGIFALALYDGRESGQLNGVKPGDLLLFRDGLGVKPLYYSETHQGFLFASELKSLLKCSETSKELDLESLIYLMTYLYSPAPQSPLKHIKKVEPGEWLLVRDGQIHSKKYFYDIPYGQTLKWDSEREIAEELRSILEAASKRQMISDVPIGAFLSGGLDSTAVVALMRKARPNSNFHCFTIGHSEAKNNLRNDLFYAKRVASQLDLPLTIVEVTPKDFKDIETVIFHLDEPQADPAALNALLISKKAREMGVKVLLSGAGGDDIFSGYPRHVAAELETVWQLFPTFLRRGMGSLSEKVLSNYGGASLLKHDRSRKVAKVLESLQWDLKKRLYSYFMCNFPAAVGPLLGERFKGISPPQIAWQPFDRTLGRMPSDETVLNQMLYLETKHFLSDHNLNYVDKMSMSQGVEVRVPLIDKDVVDFVAKIPSHLKMKKLETKYIFKQAIRDVVPSEILTRKKQGFGLPIRQWLKTELRDILEDTLSENSIRSRGLFNPKTVRDLMEKDSKGYLDATFILFSLVSIEAWCRQFLDKDYSIVQEKVCRA